MLIFPIVLAAVWSALATELVFESARSGGGLVFLGRVLAAPPPDVTVLILCAVSASAALVLAITVSRGRGRRLERRMAAELDHRWAELAEHETSDDAIRRLLSWRVAELQKLVEQLLAERRDEPGRHLVVVPDLPGNGNGNARGIAPATPASSRARSRR